YHHIHHLCAKIPNYRLAKCHDEHRHLFSAVTRLRLADVHQSFKYILWDARARQIISVAEYREQVPACSCSSESPSSSPTSASSARLDSPGAPAPPSMPRTGDAGDLRKSVAVLSMRS